MYHTPSAKQFVQLGHDNAPFTPKTDTRFNGAIKNRRGPTPPGGFLLSTFFSIIGGAAFAFVLAVVHHVFLAQLDGQNVQQFDPFWSKNASNGIANAFSLCLVLSTPCALLQIVCRTSVSYLH